MRNKNKKTPLNLLKDNLGLLNLLKTEYQGFGDASALKNLVKMKRVVKMY